MGAFCLRSLALAAPLSLWASLALAAEESAAHAWLDVMWKAVNLAILVAILVYYGRKPISGALTGMARETHDLFFGRRKAAQEAEQQLAEQKRQMETLQAELAGLAAKAREDAEREKARLLQDAQAQAQRLLAQAQLQMERELAKARAELRRQLAEETVRLAEQILRQRATPEQRQRLLTAYLEQMGARP